MKLSDFALQEAVHISTEQAWHLLDHLQSELGNQMLTPDRLGHPAPFDRDVAMNLALQELANYNLSPDGAHDKQALRRVVKINYALTRLRFLFGSHNNEVGQFVDWFDELVTLDVDLPEPLQQLRQAAIDISSEATTWEVTLQMVSHITSYVDGLVSLLASDKTGDYEKSIIRASLKKLGAMT